MKSRLTAFLVISFFSCQTLAQEKFELKVAEFVGAQHFMTQWLVKWGEKLEKASNGRLPFRHFPGAQIAPAPAHYDLARSCQADVTWFLHGGTPGRFPHTSFSHLPYTVGSTATGPQVLY